jgi:hypothetical protein
MTSNKKKTNGKRAPVGAKVPKAVRRNLIGNADTTTSVGAGVSRNNYTREPKLNVSQTATDGMVVVRHREYLQDVNVTGPDFACVALNLNPGIDSTFPWLSRLAQNYESYRFRRLTVQYETCCGTATIGTLMMAIDYDAADPAPPSKQKLLGYHNAVRSAAWNRAQFNADRADLQKTGQKFVRSNALLPNLDIKTYDVGRLFVCTQGFAAAAVTVGELYLDYEVELHTPQLSVYHTFDDSLKITSGFGDRANPLGNIPTLTVPVDSAPPIRAANDTITFNETGEFLVDMNALGTAITNVPLIGGTAPNREVFDYLINGAGTATAAKARVKITEPGQTMTLNWLATAATITAAVVRIAPYYYGLM